MRPALRHPPAFSLRVKSDPAWQRLQAGLCSLALGLLVMSFLLHQGWNLSWLALLLLCPMAMVLYLGLRAWLPQSHGTLAWDGQQWLWSDEQTVADSRGEAKVVRVAPAIDWGEWCLLRIQLPAQARGGLFAWVPQRRYIALAQRHHAALWNLLRSCLVVSGH